MKKIKLKPYVLPTVLTIMSVFAIMLTLTFSTQEELKVPNDINYVSNIILGNEIAVMNEKIRIINPYLDSSVTIGKNYYDYKGTAENQEKSIIYYDGTYMQNSGIDYVSETEFDVISILDGEIIEVKEDNALGKIVEVKHKNNYISVYQSLSNTTVKKGDTISQGQIIGKSGTNELDKAMGNHLHFELFYNGKVVNPLEHLNKEIEE